MSEVKTFWYPEGLSLPIDDWYELWHLDISGLKLEQGC